MLARSLAAALCLVSWASTADAHDWYSNLVSPSGEPCCDGRDCRPVESRYNPQSRRLELGIDGVWAPVDPGKVLPIPSADGNAHACFARLWRKGEMTPLFRCIILPGEA